MERIFNKPWKLLIDEHLKAAKRPLIVVLGPTASGKTAFSIELAKHLQGKTEIISADSRQLYKHLDIGTAKITAIEMQGAPHHLLSVLDPKEKVTAGWYKQKATNTIDEVLKRDHIPMLVGGSMLYISTVIDGLVFAGRGAKVKTSVPYDLIIFGIDCPRPVLRERIRARTETLLDGGWIEEVQQLVKKCYTEKDPGLESVGYREIIAFLEGRLSRDQLLKEINRKTLAYMKRQMTWWRGDPRIHWI